MPAYTWEEFEKVYNETKEGKNAVWKLKLKEDKMKDCHYKCMVYQKKNPGKVDFLRFESEFEGPLNIDQMFEYMINPPPDPMVTEVKQIKKDNIDSVTMYYRMKMPLCTARDNIVRIDRKHMTPDSQFLTASTVTHPDYPVTKQSIRMYSFLSGWLRPNPENPTNFLYSEISHFDMKGSIPVMLMNMALSSEATVEMKNLAKWMRSVPPK